MTSPSLRVYVLYPRFGGFSVRSIDYQGKLLYVSARSVRQAYALAHNDDWIHPEAPSPVGIVSRYDSERGRTLWCGCTSHSVTGGHVGHGDGIRAIRRAIAAHNDCPRPSDLQALRARLQRYRTSPSYYADHLDTR